MAFYYFLILFVFNFAGGLKTWIPNTNADNPLNWDGLLKTDKCQKISIDVDNDITMYWNLPNVFTIELNLPSFGNVLFPVDASITFTDKKNECSEYSSVRYIRDEHKKWLDPNNWKSDTESWVPHIERIPCAGDDIVFPPGRSFGVELPSILLPPGKIIFDDQEYDGVDWDRFLDSGIGFEYFKHPTEDLQAAPWPNDVGCARKKDCFCARSPYAIRDGLFKNVPSNLIEKAVCQYAQSTCESPKCMFPIIPDGHCCGICGGIIKLQDNTEDGLDINLIKKKINKELKNNGQYDGIITYVGRTSDGNIQIVFIAENPDETMKTLTLTNFIEEKLKGNNLPAALSSKYSGLPVRNYIFNGALGISIGTLLAVIALFLAIYYVYIILPKKRFTDMILGKQFLFARFENTMHEASSEENLEIAMAAEHSNETNKAFDNPMYSPESKSTKSDPPPDFNQASSTKTHEEYSNPVYTELEKSEMNIFENENSTENIAEDNTEEDKLNIFSEVRI